MDRTRPAPKVQAKMKNNTSKVQKKSNATNGPKKASRATIIRPKNHRFSLKQRAVIAYLFASNSLNLSESDDDALRIFRNIFPDKTGVKTQMLIEDFSGLDKKAGTDVYNTRICKEYGTFTQDEIIAHRHAISEIERAAIRLGIDLDFDKLINADFGKPTDGEFTRVSTPLSRIERAVIDGYGQPIGWTEKPYNWTCPTKEYKRQVAENLNKVMLVSSGRSTRSTLGRVGRTPSVEPVLQNGVFVRVNRNAQHAPAPAPQANPLPIIEEEVDGDEEEEEGSQNNGEGDDQDEDEQGDTSEMEDDDDHDDLEYGAAGNEEDPDEIHEEHDQGGEIGNRYDEDNRGGVYGVFFNVPEDENNNEANRLTLNTHTKIKKEWLDLRTMYYYMFTLQDALTSDHSPLSASYVPSLRMFHRNSLLNEWSGDHYNCPPAFMAIPPTDKLYKQGGPLFRIFNDEAGLMEDIMACNDAFCKICVVSRVPPPENPEQNLHSMPFVHHRSLGYGFEDARPEGGQENLLFTGNASTGFGSVLPTSACRPNFCGVIMIDRVQRSVVVCDSARCEECQGAA
jgi:hypothetical protein